jgi:hypothetical protein
MSLRRREFIAGFGGAAVWPLVANAQQAAKPVIGMMPSIRICPFAPQDYQDHDPNDALPDPKVQNTLA